MATPVVSGVAALLMGYFPELTAAEAIRTQAPEAVVISGQVRPKP